MSNDKVQALPYTSSHALRSHTISSTNIKQTSPLEILLKNVIKKIFY